MPAIQTTQPTPSSAIADTALREVTVLITGFGPWDTHTVNPSDSIASSLPSSTKAGTRIVVRTPIEVSYDHVDSAVPQMLDEIRPDIVLHIGLAPPLRRTWYAIERSAPRTGYVCADARGRCWTQEKGADAVPGQQPGKGKEGNEWADAIYTGLDYNQVLEGWRARCESVGKVDIRDSDDVEAYLPGFIYYTTLGWFKAKGVENPPVLFLHVPDLPEKEDVECGTQVTMNLIESMAESWSSRQNIEKK